MEIGLLTTTLLLVGAYNLAAEPTASLKPAAAHCRVSTDRSPVPKHTETPHGVKAIKKPVLRHTKGLHGIEMSGGIASIGKFLALDWRYYFSAGWQIKLGLGSEWKKQERIFYQNLFTQPVLAYTILSNKRNVYLNVLGGTILAYGRYQEERQHKKQGNFNGGLVLGGELALFIVDRLELLLGAAPRIFFLKDPYGKIDYYLSVGIRITY